MDFVATGSELPSWPIGKAGRWRKHLERRGPSRRIPRGEGRYEKAALLIEDASISTGLIQSLREKQVNVSLYQ